MEPSIIVALIGLLVAPLAAVVSWMVSKRKTDSDIGTSIIVASADAVEAIRGVMDSLKVELAETKRELHEFKAQNKELEDSLKLLKAQNVILLEQNVKLAEEINTLKDQVGIFSSSRESQSHGN